MLMPEALGRCFETKGHQIAAWGRQQNLDLLVHAANLVHLMYHILRYLEKSSM